MKARATRYLLFALGLLFLAAPLELTRGEEKSPPGTYLQKLCTFHSPEAFRERTRSAEIKLHREARCLASGGEVLEGSSRGIVLSRGGGAPPEPYPPDVLLPSSEVTVIAEEAPGRIWIGTTRGAALLDRRSGRSSIQYFASRRWLLDDRVTGIGFEAPRPGAVWIETPGGYSRIEWRPMRLADKAPLFEGRVRARHVRHGLTADSHLRVPGDLGSNETISTDNDGLWTAMYVAAECFRFKVTGEPEARDFARQGLEALMRLESITGIKGFPARSFIKVGAEREPGDGEWHPTADGLWKWKGDTSSDELVGHYFAYAVYYHLLADEKEKREIREVVGRITSHLLDHGYHLVDVDGKTTRWGWYAPEEIWADPDETGLRALHMLSHLRVANHITGIPRYEEAYRELALRQRYALLTLHQKINIPGSVNHSDDELAFLSYYPLLLFEKEGELRRIYEAGLERSWRVERPERNPLWNFIYAAGTRRKDCDLEESLETLRRIPMDLISWTVTNSHRLDVVTDREADRHGRGQSLVVLPPDERRVMKWNGNPYELDGGSGGAEEDDGAFFLLPYWMGRYHGLTGE